MVCIYLPQSTDLKLYSDVPTVDFVDTWTFVTVFTSRDLGANIWVLANGSKMICQPLGLIRDKVYHLDQSHFCQLLIFVGCSFLSITHYCWLLICVGCSCQFVSNHYKWTWVALLFELLMSFWDKSVQTKVGCSLMSVAHVNLGQTITN